jgi:hypothetical protein
MLDIKCSIITASYLLDQGADPDVRTLDRVAPADLSYALGHDKVPTRLKLF